MEPKETKTRLLDAAEHLFAENGYHGTSLRMITTAAGANLAAVNYHFGSKEALIEAVIERRLLPLNRLRTERLQALLADADNRAAAPDLRQTLAAFIEPTLSFRHAGPGNRDFIALIARAMADPNDTARNIFISRVLPVFKLWHQCLSQALPQLDAKTLSWRLHFAIGALSHIMHNLDKLPPADAMPPAADSAREITEMLLSFLCPGMEAPQ
ncbi:MAG: CerR family C-terminal domain-containing protein [Desulfobulbaceae bacterium]|nr:CerR family C-terminal domain-containing protein [Desulfobulbaceae bacterium]